VEPTVAFRRQLISESFGAMTDDTGATLLPAAHRYAGKPYAWIITRLIGHTTAHATQIRQFTDARGTPGDPLA
jgi:hypothetical protein